MIAIITEYTNKLLPTRDNYSQLPSQGRIFGGKKDVSRGMRGQKGVAKMKGAKKCVEHIEELRS